MKLSEKVLRIMEVESIKPEELCFMVEHAAITSVRGFNRRYFHWLFNMKGDSLLDMQHFHLLETGHGTTKMLEDHEVCAGKGCRECGWAGVVARWVTDKEVPTMSPLRIGGV